MTLYDANDKPILSPDAPDPETCDHGVTFDLEEARKISARVKTPSTGDLATDFILGPVNATHEIRKRWPRLFGPCPKRCGFNGIAYASTDHYYYGDW